MKNDRMKNDRIKSDRMKNYRIKSDRIKSITDPIPVPVVKYPGHVQVTVGGAGFEPGTAASTVWCRPVALANWPLGDVVILLINYSIEAGRKGIVSQDWGGLNVQN
jgi:hypothetical protein